MAVRRGRVGVCFSATREASVGPWPNSPRFIHLRVHTEYSLLEGAVRLKELPKLAAAAGMPAVAVTDTNNLFAALEFSVGAAAEGVQPIIGCQVDWPTSAPAPGEAPVPPGAGRAAGAERGGLPEPDEAELRPLPRRGAGGCRRSTLDELAAHAEGLICLTGGPDGPVGRLLRAGSANGPRRWWRGWPRHFRDRLYVELQRHPGEDGGRPRPSG